MRKSRLFSAAAAALLSLTMAVSAPVQAAPKKDFKVCWTIYAGWMPWEYAASSGIMEKWAKKYDIKVDVVQVNDYIESINQYTAGSFDGCAMTNMDALTIPAAGGVDTTALIIGDFSNGNDGIVIKGKGKTVASLKGKPVNLVELSVSHYLLARALETAGMSERDTKVVNTSDADLVAAFATSGVDAVVTWNPLLAEVAATPNVTKVFDSSKIPGEIIDLMVVNSKTLAENPALGKALTGAWYEVMSVMSADTPAGKAARQKMAAASGTDLAGYEAQLAATKMFYTAPEAVAFATSKSLPTTMTKVAQFSFQHGLLGEGARSADAIGMSFATGTTGDAKNVKLRFDPSFMKMAADGKLN
ncbi:lipid kinase [Parazoarcus communis]|uniref:Lipid kinase n=1 Tax=Parazoarcus communis TaxID=41977 RepID=A0A2U8GU16_9RHOO|nr:putative urea ABC transporter substrate-binding protein [Parazoarcus communis]AWI76743.1 lipid kinase [Parazoarcus communis]TVT59020.1 MAG: lipid kinase [Azoarcus sp. PHD]|tara:strand:- start:26909 stop:27985 length:1077 start_codon:yes stop_codon:yes gene_type:complete